MDISVHISIVVVVIRKICIVRFICIEAALASVQYILFPCSLNCNVKVHFLFIRKYFVDRRVSRCVLERDLLNYFFSLLIYNAWAAVGWSDISAGASLLKVIRRLKWH